LQVVFMFIIIQGSGTHTPVSVKNFLSPKNTGNSALIVMREGVRKTSVGRFATHPEALRKVPHLKSFRAPLNDEIRYSV
jgi:hypothetical protein